VQRIADGEALATNVCVALRGSKRVTRHIYKYNGALPLGLSGGLKAEQASAGTEIDHRGSRFEFSEAEDAVAD